MSAATKLSFHNRKCKMEILVKEIENISAQLSFKSISVLIFPAFCHLKCLCRVTSILSGNHNFPVCLLGKITIAQHRFSDFHITGWIKFDLFADV